MTQTQRQKVDRDEVFLELTKSVCPMCKAVIEAEVNIRDNRVVMRKRCREHGEFEALIYSDAELYMSQLRYNKPGTLPLQFQTEVKDGCPLDCGLCPQHKQHSCFALIEVNTKCNLDCPICFADSGHQPDGYQLTRDDVERMLDAFVAAEGSPEVVQLSGGEPTIHPDIIEFVELAQARDIGTVMINTNGIRLARDRRFLAELERLKPHIYLQFDGFDEATHLAIRGKDLRGVKRRALDNCVEAGLKATLVVAVERSVNEHEVGSIVRHGVKHPAVTSIVFQPVTHAGRHREFDPLDRLTNADVMKLIVEQVPEWFELTDFTPVPCCFPTCRSMCYMLVDGDNAIPFTRLVDLDEHLDYVSNRVNPDPAVQHAIERMFSSSAMPGAEQALLACDSCGIDLPEALKNLRESYFMIAVQDFQDPYTLNVRQLMKCCVEQITPDGRLIPFCAYNSVGYREQVREQMSGTRVEPVVPNATQLQPVLQPTRYGSKTIATNGGNARLAKDERSVGSRLQR
ncbi:MAG TPA: radical SAM protein [Thermoleophilaceae bacterium]